MGKGSGHDIDTPVVGDIIEDFWLGRDDAPVSTATDETRSLTAWKERHAHIEKVAERVRNGSVWHRLAKDTTIIPKTDA